MPREFIGSNIGSNDSLISQTADNTYSSNSGYDFSDNLLFRHKFAKKGRTFSVAIGTDVNSKSGYGKGHVSGT